MTRAGERENFRRRTTSYRLAHPARGPFSRSAFTLVETMLVLALLVALGAMVWPSLQKPFASQRLRKSGDQLHAHLTRARATAMRTGTARQLTLDPTPAATGSGARYTIGPIADGMAAQPAGYQATTAQLSEAQPATGGSAYGTGVETHALPEGVSIVSVEAFDDVAPPPYAAGFAPAAASNTGTQAGQVASSSTVYFHPDGSTSSARFTLANEDGLYLRVELRGLTGAVKASDVVTAEQGP